MAKRNTIAPIDGMAVFAYGFRPFFLLAGIYAALVVPLWLNIHLGAPWWATTWPSGLWHAHEMVFGFATAAIAGFLLTAVPSWTGTPPHTGVSLARLVALWAAGRVAMWMTGIAPAWLVGAIDIAFLPALAWAIMGPLNTVKGPRNRVFLIFIGLLTVANGLTHLAAHGYVTPILGSELAIDVLAIMIAIIGGRVIPAFTTNALAADGREDAVRPTPSWDVLAPILVGVTALADVGRNLWPEYTQVAGIVALAAAYVNGWRMAGWATWHCRGKSILWVLHLGYAWLVAGLAAKGFASFGWIDSTAAIHALGVGMIGTMPLAIMSRASLGHTGRPLIAARAITFAYVLVTLAALARIWAADVDQPILFLVAAAAAWTTAFTAFSLVYWPILTRPRIDGRSG